MKLIKNNWYMFRYYYANYFFYLIQEFYCLLLYYFTHIKKGMEISQFKMWCDFFGQKTLLKDNEVNKKLNIKFYIVIYINISNINC